MTRMMLVSAAALALAGCGGESQTTENSAAATGEVFLTNASAEEVARQAAAANRHARMQPGQWNQSLEIVSVDFPGMPDGPQKTAAMEMLKPASRENSRCITQEQADRANVQALANGGQNCFYHQLRIADGRIDARFTCTTPNQDKVESTMSGDYGPTKVDLTIDSRTDFASQPGAVEMKMRIAGERVGDCAS